MTTGLPTVEHTAPPDRSELHAADRLAVAITDARTELGRVDAKAGTLLGIDGVLLGLIGSVLLTQLHGGAAVLGWTAVALYAASAIALLTAIYPRLTYIPGSLLDQAALTPQEIAATYADPERVLTIRAQQLPGLARMAHAKYRVLQAAVWLLAAGVVVLLAALAVAVA